MALTLVTSNRLAEIAAEIRTTWGRIQRDTAETRRLLEEARDLCRARRESFDRWCLSGKIGIGKTQIYNLLGGHTNSNRIHSVNVSRDNRKFYSPKASPEEIDDPDDEILNIFVSDKKKLPMEVGFWKEQSSSSCEWYTCKYIFDALDVHFDLDPASPGLKIVPWIPADHCHTLADDGLAQPWHGLVWLNPPFGRNRLIHWVRKFIQHGNGVILVPERTSTVWYQEIEAASDLILHLNKKIPFVVPFLPEGERSQFPIGTHLIAMGKKGVAGLINAHRAGLGLLSKPYIP